MTPWNWNDWWSRTCLNKQTEITSEMVSWGLFPVKAQYYVDCIACNRLNDGWPDCYSNGAQQTEITNEIILEGLFNSL